MVRKKKIDALLQNVGILKLTLVDPYMLVKTKFSEVLLNIYFIYCMSNNTLTSVEDETDNPCPGEGFIFVGRSSQQYNIDKQNARRISDGAKHCKEKQQVEGWKASVGLGFYRWWLGKAYQGGEV